MFSAIRCFLFVFVRVTLNRLDFGVRSRRQETTTSKLMFMHKLSLVTIVLFTLALCGSDAVAQVRLRSEEADKLLVEKTEPEYPGVAKMLKLQGTVSVDATVSESGSVVSAKVLTGDVNFKTAATSAVMKRKYKPHLVNGTPTPFVTTITLEFSLGIPKEEYERDRRVAEQFFPIETKCRSLAMDENWKDAEKVCNDALQQAELFKFGRELEKLGAYELMGHVMRGQKRYREALDYYKRAQVAAGSKLDEKDAELGRLYGDMAITHHLLRELDKARELYSKAERVLQAAYDNMKSDEPDQELETLRSGYIRRLRRLLEYHLIAAEDSGSTAEADAIKKLMKSLP